MVAAAVGEHNAWRFCGCHILQFMHHPSLIATTKWDAQPAAAAGALACHAAQVSAGPCRRHSRWQLQQNECGHKSHRNNTGGCMTTCVCLPPLANWLPGVAEPRIAVCPRVWSTGWHSRPPWSHPGVALAQAMNVLGGPLQCCCEQPLTGYYRDGFCRTGGGDFGAHVVCAQVRDRENGTPAALFITPSRAVNYSSHTQPARTCTDW